jgi:hypothetical protein
VTGDPSLLLGETSSSVSAYGEYGISPRLTFVFDTARVPGSEIGSSLVWLRQSLSRTAATHQFALSAGLGRQRTPFGSAPLTALGASWGRGFNSALGGGWTTLDLQYRLAPEGLSVGKVDGTVGLRPNKKSHVYGQLQLTLPDTGDASARVSMNYVRDVTGALSVELGLLYGVVNNSDAGVRSGIWLDF